MGVCIVNCRDPALLEGFLRGFLRECRNISHRTNRIPQPIYLVQVYLSLMHRLLLFDSLHIPLIDHPLEYTEDQTFGTTGQRHNEQGQHWR